VKSVHCKPNIITFATSIPVRFEPAAAAGGVQMNFWDNCFERDDLTVTNDEDRDIGNQAHDRLITTANSCIVAFCLFPLLKLSIFNT